jgi:predicted amidohydrolase
MQNNSEKLNIALFQTDLTWESPADNIKRLAEQIDDFRGADIIILPEMFTTGFSMEPEHLSEPDKGESYQAIAKLAVRADAAIVFSMITEVQAKYFNRLYFIFPDGSSAHYDKKHLFTMGEEDRHYSPGDRRLYVDYKGWRIMPLVCYDLRFPVWSRNVSNYDLLIYIANWPQVRADVWKSLLKARALENQAYVAGVNRIGTDGRNLEYSGDSQLIDARGNLILDMKSGHNPAIKTIDKTSLYDFRKKFPVLNDKDSFRLT